MKLPETPIPVVFKSSRSMNKVLKKDIKTIPGSSQMGQLPLNHVVVMHNEYCTRFRLTGNRNYSYAEFSTSSNGYTDVDISGRVDSLQKLDEFLYTVNIIKPFVNNLYKK